MSCCPSRIYPTLSLALNPDEEFISDYLIPEGYKTLLPDDPLNPIYLKAVCRLFSEMAHDLEPERMWICRNQSSLKPVNVYFTWPKKYLITSCCHACVYIQFDVHFSGTINCSKCLTPSYQFVHCQNNDPDKEVVNQRFFREFKENMENNRLAVRKLISSNKHRQKNLKKFLQNPKACKKRKEINLGEFIVQISPNNKEESFEEMSNCNQKEDRTISMTVEQEEIRKIISHIFA